MTTPPPDTKRILLVDDEQHLATGLKLNFELEGYRVDVATTGREATRLLAQPEPYDVIVLDVMLPDLDGFTLCRRLRHAGNLTPVIMLTARTSIDDRVEGLEAGADDYLPKPFELNELLARVNSLLRRRRWDNRDELSAQGHARLVFGDADIDFDSHKVTVGGDALKLTKLELDLLRYFAEHPGVVISREALLEHVWGVHQHTNTRTVDNFIVRLRRYFEPTPSSPRFFISVRGAGYRFEPQGA